MQQQLTLAYQEVRECNAYSSNFGLVLSDPEITELVACRAEMRMERLKNIFSLCPFHDIRKSTSRSIRFLLQK